MIPALLAQLAVAGAVSDVRIPLAGKERPTPVPYVTPSFVTVPLALRVPGARLSLVLPDTLRPRRRSLWGLPVALAGGLVCALACRRPGDEPAPSAPPVVVPEPRTVALLAGGVTTLVLLGAWRRRAA